jgi:hypothetical protein
MRRLPVVVLLFGAQGCTPLKPSGDRVDGGCALHHPLPPPNSATESASRSQIPSAARDLVFAIATTDFGSEPTDAGGPAYKTFGFDLDNACKGVDGCVEPSWATSSHHVGDEGIDNAYGQLIEGTYSNSANASAETPEVLFRIRDYSGAPDQDPVDVSIYVALGLARDDGSSEPVWDGKDRWNILPEFLADTGDGGALSVGQPRFHADRAYVTGFTLVARFDETLWPGEAYFAPRLLVTAHQLTIQGKLTPVGDAGAGWELPALVAGLRVSATDSLTILALQNLTAPDGGAVQYCQDKPSYDSAKQLFCSFVDVTADPNAVRSTPCDALSAGVIYHAREALLGGIKGPAPPLPGCALGILPLGTDSCDTLTDP